MDITLTGQFYAEIAKRLAACKSFQDVYEIINSACVTVFDTGKSAIFAMNYENNVFIRKSLKLKNGLHGAVDFPVYLKLSQVFEPYSRKKYLINSLRPSPFFETDPFQDGSEMIIPVRVKNETVAFVLCRSEERTLLSKEQEYFCEFIQHQLALAMQKCMYADEIEMLKQERKKLESISDDSLKLINDRLYKSNQELKQFAYTVSHDLQEPLRMITNYINLYYKHFGATLTAEGREYLDFAKDGASRLHTLIKDLLAYAKLDYTDEPKQLIDGNKMLGEALKNLRVAIEENEALIFYRDMPEMYGHENQLVSLFQNLVDNAIKYKGDRAPDIFIDVENTREQTYFSVKDNGIGIEQIFHDRIFEFFSRLHAKDEYKGNGLGLSICKKIVEKHAGTITVDSTPGKGSKFRFSLSKS